MAFIPFQPLQAVPWDIETCARAELQLWQELVMLRHTPRAGARPPQTETDPWIDQAKTYFLDAFQSNWRSAGLLYYYSFLNLAKAHLAAQQKLSIQALKATSLYHGLQADHQSPKLLSEFKITIYPPNGKSRTNVFANFYETATNSAWPFPKEITITLAEIMGYCRDVAIEAGTLFSIAPRVTKARSLLKMSATECWFEMLVPEHFHTQLKPALPWSATLTQAVDFSDEDKNDWLFAYQMRAIELRNTVLVRSAKYQINKALDAAINTVTSDITNALANNAVPTPINDHDWWLFSADVTLEGALIPWRPILSDYLVAFALSTILRYQPHIIDFDSPNAFFSLAWCNQAPLTVLRFFVQLFTKPPLRVQCL